MPDAGRVLLGRAGHPSELRVGAAKSPASGFEAHAWLEHRGQVVLGGLDDLFRYVPMRPAGNRF
jgi:Transglutaminase-like superfamily